MKCSLILLISVFAGLAGCTQPKKARTVTHPPKAELAKYSQATFAAGCFWHEEALFESIKGVKEAISGYAGGTSKNPSYESIEQGNTGHAEAVTVYYDPKEIDYRTLLKVYFAGQDPTQVNGQGNDRGTQYRSIAFYRNAAEKSEIEGFIKQLQSKYTRPIAVQVIPYSKFWTAEDYHQDFIEKNPGQLYVNAVSIPEIQKVQWKYPELVKAGYRY